MLDLIIRVRGNLLARQILSTSIDHVANLHHQLRRCGRRWTSLLGTVVQRKSADPFQDFANAVDKMSRAGYKGEHGHHEVPEEDKIKLDALYMQATVGDYGMFSTTSVG